MFSAAWYMGIPPSARMADASRERLPEQAALIAPTVAADCKAVPSTIGERTLLSFYACICARHALCKAECRLERYSWTAVPISRRGPLISGCKKAKTLRVVGASQRLDSCVSASIDQLLDQAVDCGPACIALVILPRNALPT